MRYSQEAGFKVLFQAPYGGGLVYIVVGSKMIEGKEHFAVILEDFDTGAKIGIGIKKRFDNRKDACTYATTLGTGIDVCQNVEGDNCRRTGEKCIYH